MPPPPKVGQCRSTPADHLESFPGRPVAHGVHADDWVDETPAIECSRAHTLETVEVITLAEEPTLGLVKQSPIPAPLSQDWAISAFRAPASGPSSSWSIGHRQPEGPRVSGGVRCDVGVRAMDGCCQLAPQTRSLRGAVDSDPVRFQMCIDQVPDPNRIQPLSSCKKPHRAELLPTTIQAEVTQYPSAGTLNKKGRSGCADLTADRDDRADLVITAFWRPDKAEWSGGTLEGFCFIHRKTGLIPPIK